MFDQCDTKGRLVSTNRTHHLSFANKAFFHRELGKGTAGDALRKFLGGGPVSNQVKYEMESASKRVPIQSTSKSIPLRSSQKRCPESPRSDEESNYTEKENLLNKKQRILSSSTSSPFGSEKKKRIVNPFSSVKKAARRTRNALTDNTPTKQYALGDSEPTVDVTGECNQS